ncbi:MAG: hypothetical protein AAGJ54_12495 [Planctomycetota bacterium]
MREFCAPAAAAACLFACGIAAPAFAQSDPSTFGTFYNIGTVPAGSFADVSGAVTGTQVGDGNFTFGEAFITPTFLGGDTLGSNSQLNLFDGGEILTGFRSGLSDGTGSNTELNVAGGTVGSFFRAFSGSTVNISRGSVGSSFVALDGSTVNISGGSVGNFFDAFDGSTVNLFGTSFFLDGIELTDLVFGESFTITDRDATLTGLLADDSAFEFDLNSADVFGEDFFDVGTTLTVTLVPAPGAAGVLALAGLAASRRRRRG